MTRNQRARVDGFTITGADTGGGIVVNGYGDYVEISNNRVANNSGNFAAASASAIRCCSTRRQNGYEDGMNDFVRVHHNTVNQNGALAGAGAGISMGAGSDSYQVTDNWVCGNFNTADGGGIGHMGLSDRAANNQPIPLIARNRVIFNEIFAQGPGLFSGGGIFIGGAPPVAGGTLSPGSGNVQVVANLIQGNGAGAGDGGGVRLANVNGQDVEPDQQQQQNAWYGVDLFDNMIVNNVAGLAGGGVSLQDAVKVRIFHDTIANNDSLGTQGDAFAGAPTSRRRSPAPASRPGPTARLSLAAPVRRSGPSPIPNLQNTIAWHNRKFYFWVDQTSGCTPGDPACTSTYGLCPDLDRGAELPRPWAHDPVYDDLGVIGAAGPLTCDGGDLHHQHRAGTAPRSSGRTSTATAPGLTQPEITTAIQAPAAFDEGGNFIRPNYGPLTLVADPTTDGDAEPAVGLPHHGSHGPQGGDLSGTVPTDYDGQTFPATPDVGADELP